MDCFMKAKTRTSPSISPEPASPKVLMSNCTNASNPREVTIVIDDPRTGLALLQTPDDTTKGTQLVPSDQEVQDLLRLRGFPLGKRTLMSYARDARYLVVMLTQHGPFRCYHPFEALLEGGDRHIRIETLLVLDPDSLQELGSAAFRQVWTPGLESVPEPKWSRVALRDGDLVLDPETLSEVPIPQVGDVLPEFQEAVGKLIGRDV